MSLFSLLRSSVPLLSSCGLVFSVAATSACERRIPEEGTNTFPNANDDDDDDSGNETLLPADDDDDVTSNSDDDDDNDDNDDNDDDSESMSDDPGEETDLTLPDFKYDVMSPDVPKLPQGCPTLKAIIRDFSTDHPDFQTFDGDLSTPGLVQAMLGSDKKPVYGPTGPSTQLSGKMYFDQWYRDTSGVNMPFEFEIKLEEKPMSADCSYSNNKFFPIDGKGFGSEGLTDKDGNEHNFLFTTEIHTVFTYSPGQVFTFIGDDDLWMFVDNKLAIDLGGLHPALEKTVNLDTLGLTPGVNYDMDIFHAERHTFDSNFRIDSNIDFHPPK